MRRTVYSRIAVHARDRDALLSSGTLGAREKRGAAEGRSAGGGKKHGARTLTTGTADTTAGVPGTKKRANHAGCP